MHASDGVTETRVMAVFTVLPDHFRKHGILTEWSKVNRLGHSGDSFLEAPVVDASGNLYVSDLEYGRIFRIDSAGSWELVSEFDGEPNGMKFIDPRTLVVADYKNGLVLVDIVTGAVEPLLERRGAERFKGPNDLIFDSRGNLYFSDQGQTGLQDPTGRVYRLAPDRRLDLLLNCVPGPNSLALSLDERVLFVAATRANAVWRVPLLEDCGVAKVSPFFTANGPIGPDGLAMDVGGSLFVTLAGRGVTVALDRFAEPRLILRSPTGSLVTNLAFGGADKKTLFCTESETGSILSTRMEVAGRILPIPNHRFESTADAFGVARDDSDG